MTNTNASHGIAGSAEIITPAVLVFHDRLERNLAKMIKIAGNPARLRPHCKTYKLREVVRLQLEKQINKFKAATFAEAEMLVSSGVQDVLLAYNVVGPNICRAVQFVKTFPQVTFAVTADHAVPIQQLGTAMSAENQTIDVLLDFDAGMHRTGIAPGTTARELYRQIVQQDGLRAGGLHVYDGHHHQVDVNERRTACMACWESVSNFRDSLVGQDWPVPRIVMGGTGSFPIYASIEDPSIELSPGTCVFHDAGYTASFPDMDFEPAALILTRVISRPTSDRVTLDLGYKAVAADPPADRRVLFPDLPDAKLVIQNEEHLVIETSSAERFQPGDELLAVPYHICPTTALHKQVHLIRDGAFTECWDVVARDRRLTV